jgi:hypothetical protein
MRHKGKSARKNVALLVYASILLLVSLPPAAAGPVVAPGQKLFLIKTLHFDIIFPEASRPSALRLAAMADSVYDEIAAKLDTKVPTRMPVVITPDIGSYNGYTNPFPYMHIVLYDTSLDLGWTAFKDNFRSLFLHELTHAVSLQIKAPWASFLSGIFGSWVLPGLLNTPEFMTEGVAVSFESAEDSGGRANDPLVKERVRQDIIENRFKSPIEASGIYDEYPYGNIFYEYGGLFNAYIQKTYGMERYAALWKAMGTIVLSFSLDPYEIGFYKAFHKTYGIPFLKAWADFRSSLQLSRIVDPPETLGPKELAWMPGGLAGNESFLYWVDARSNRAMKMELATQKSSVLFDADSSTAISDAARGRQSLSATGGEETIDERAAARGRLLVSRAVLLPDGRDRNETIVYDLQANRFVPGTAVPGMREARFFRGGFVGIVSRLHNTDLVFVSREGTEVLLPGSEEVMYSSPAVLDEKRLALIVAIGGRRSIGILDADSGSLSLVKPAEEDAELFTYVRQLSASEGKIYFNYNSDDRLYKLGVLDLAATDGAGDQAIRLETTDYSGGVLSPRVAGGRIYYIGRFSEGDKLCRYPGEAASVGERRLSCSLEAFDPRGPAAESEATTAAAEAVAKVEPYRPLAYANPFNMWFVYPDPTVMDRTLRILGIFAFQDPIGANTASLAAGYDSAYPFAEASLAWTNTALPVALGASAEDNLVYGAVGAPERQSSASLSATLSLPVFPSPRRATLGLGGSVLDRADGEGGSPYAWNYKGWNATASALVGWLGRVPGVAASTSRGLDLVSYHDLDIASLAYKTEAHLVASYDRAPIRLEIWGAWASSPILKLDSTSTVFSGDRRPAYAEYEALDVSSSNLLAEGAIAYRLANQAIHSNVLDLYFNRLLIDVGFRGAYFRNEMLGSSFARLSFDLAAADGMAAGGLRVFGEAFVRLNVSSSNDIFGWRLGLQLDTDSGTPMKGEALAERRDAD